MDRKSKLFKRITHCAKNKLTLSTYQKCDYAIHNDADHTPAALPNILKCIKDGGYEFLFISDLILKENYKINHMGK